MNYSKYIPLGLFTLYSSKLLILGANWSDAPVLIVLAMLSGFYEKYSIDKKLILIETRLKNLDDTIGNKAKELEDLKTHVSGLKLATQMKGVGRF